MESLSTYTTWVPGQTCWPVSRTSPRFGYVSREPQTRSSAPALPRRCRSAVLSRSPGTTSAMTPPTWPLAPNSPFAATLASAAWHQWRMSRWSAEYPFLDCYQKLQVLHTMMVAVTHSDEGGRLPKSISSDIRMIISVYLSEKLSDDHPYIWRYTTEG